MPRGEVATAAIGALFDSGAAVTVLDFEAYVKIEGRIAIRFDLDDIGARLGRNLTMAEFLGDLSTYIGRIVMGDRVLEVSSDLPGMPETVSR
jgi:hypothetical protein